MHCLQVEGWITGPTASIITGSEGYESPVLYLLQHSHSSFDLV